MSLTVHKRFSILYKGMMDFNHTHGLLYSVANSKALRISAFNERSYTLKVMLTTETLHFLHVTMDNLVKKIY